MIYINIQVRYDMQKSKTEKQAERIVHPIPPLYDKQSKILILGSFPSVKSREAAFFYGHPQNRFWRLMARLLSEPFPETVEERADLLHRNHIAVWDVIGSCEIVGSSDSSIRNVTANDLSVILTQAPIRKIYCNGATSYQYYQKYIEKNTGIPAVKLPSTSPANAAWNMDRLADSWRQILLPLQIAPAGIGDVLVRWYEDNARILPWREDPSPYHVWISEIMLQQTRVEAVKDYYDRWMRALPDIRSLAEVDDNDLMKLWEGLGYYSRVRNLKTAAITIMEQYDGKLPDDHRELLSLKGIGAYTAGAIASIAFDQPYAAIDGNVLRVFSRILMEEGKINDTNVKRSLEQEVLRVMPKDRPGDFNQALMDLGATVCLPNGKPLCDRCPWEAICQAHKQGREKDFPVREKKKPRRIEEKTVFVIECHDGNFSRILLGQRPEKGLLAGLWEYPNIDSRCSMEKAAEILKIWGFNTEDLISLGDAKHIFTHVEWHMTGYYLKVDTLSPQVEKWIADRNLIWATKEEIAQDYAIPSAFEAFKQI